MIQTATAERKTDNWISELVGVLHDPIICWPNALDKPPEKIQQAITLQRLLENMIATRESRDPLATDAECAWYISGASLEHPLSSEWTRVYMYVFTQTCGLMQTEVPPDLKVDKLSDYELHQYLLPLKRWIYQKRSEKRKYGDKLERREKKESEKNAKTELQTAMFEI